MANAPHRIQYVVSTLAATGPTRQLLNIVTNLNRSHYAPHVVTLSPEPDQSYHGLFRDADVPVTSLALSRAGGLVLGPSRLRSITTAIDPDVVHTQGIRADSLAAHCLFAYPQVTTLRNFPPEDYIPRYGAVLGRLMAWQQFRTARLADQPVACSETIRDRYRGRDVAAIAIRNGVDAESYTPPSKAERERIRAELGFEQGETVVISVGGLIERKDPETVIDGFQRSETSETGSLLLLGDGPLANQCRVRAGPSVSLLGHIDDVARYLRAADVFVSASHSEGLPNAVMEALATSVPAVLSDIGPHQEILSVNPDGGALFERSDPDALARTLDTVAGSVEDRRQAARNAIETELNAVTMTQRYESVYDDLIDC